MAIAIIVGVPIMYYIFEGIKEYYIFKDLMNDGNTILSLIDSNKKWPQDEAGFAKLIPQEIGAGWHFKSEENNIIRVFTFVLTPGDKGTFYCEFKNDQGFSEWIYEGSGYRPLVKKGNTYQFKNKMIHNDGPSPNGLQP